VIVLDTNVISELMKPFPDPSVRDWLAQLGDMPLTTTAVTITEIEYGLQRLPDGRRKADLGTRFEALASALSVLPLDDLAGREAGRLWAMRDTAGFPSQPSDMMIAGITATAGAALATRNTRDFEHLPIQLIDPWRAYESRMT
jgi:predicted nucleic acid-binding protein